MSEINWGQQGNNGAARKNFKNWAQRTGPKIKRARGQTIGWKYPNSENGPFQAGYRGTRKMKVTVNGVAVDISEGLMGAFFAHYKQVEEVSAIISKAGIATGDFVLQMTMNPWNQREWRKSCYAIAVLIRI